MEVGEQLLIRHVFDERVFFALPAGVVADDGTLLAVWIADGTPCMLAAARSRDGTYLPLDAWRLNEQRWRNGVLRVVRRGSRHSILHFWDGDGSFAGWYVNLEDPLRDRGFGYDTVDHGLDIWIDPDGSWRWKDEADLEFVENVGIARAQDVRAEGERVIAEWPFPTGWEDWRPDPAWPAPELPAGWDVV